MSQATNTPLASSARKPWIDEPIQLVDLLKLDLCEGDDPGVKEAYGDTYLCTVNPLYRQVRQMFLSLGFSYSAAPVDLLHQDYSSLSLLLLQDLIDSRTVPVLDNAGVLRRAVQHTPTFSPTPAFLLANLRRNHLLHESSHCIAYEILSPLVTANGSRDQNAYVLVCLLCEAYANSIERICALSADSDEHRFLFMLNSYVDVGPTNMLKACLPLLGLERVLWLSILVFLRVNRGVPCSEADIHNLVAPWRAQDPSLTAGDLVVMSLLVETLAASLNLSFVKNTTPVFFRYMGCEEEYRAACNENALLDAGGQAIFQKLAELVGLTCRGVTVTAPARGE